ncbi:MAG: hypothetical protein DME25_16565, partial [Verrucomicrobia bacterium]
MSPPIRLSGRSSFNTWHISRSRRRWRHVCATCRPARFARSNFFAGCTKGSTGGCRKNSARSSEVSVGRHVAPASKQLRRFLERFAEFYGPRVTTHPDSLVAAASAHHRLAWIHPFLDGNGRVARLFTQAWFIKAGIASDGLWTISRGLARRRADYRAALANADEKRLNDFDGRGYLSLR